MLSHTVLISKTLPLDPSIRMILSLSLTIPAIAAVGRGATKHPFLGRCPAARSWRIGLGHLGGVHMHVTVSTHQGSQQLSMMDGCGDVSVSVNSYGSSPGRRPVGTGPATIVGHSEQQPTPHFL